MTSAVDAWGVPRPAEPPGDVPGADDYKAGELVQTDVEVSGDTYTLGVQHSGRIAIRAHSDSASAREVLWTAVWWAWQRGVPGDEHSVVRASDRSTALPTLRLGALYDLSGLRGEPP